MLSIVPWIECEKLDSETCNSGLLGLFFIHFRNSQLSQFPFPGSYYLHPKYRYLHNSVASYFSLVLQDNNDKKEGKKSKKKTTASDDSNNSGAEKMETDSGSADADGASKEKTPNKQIAHQGVAVLGIALVAMGEDIGSEMCFRSFGHLVSCLSHWSGSIGRDCLDDMDLSLFFSIVDSLPICMQ